MVWEVLAAVVFVVVAAAAAGCKSEKPVIDGPGLQIGKELLVCIVKGGMRGL